MSVRYTGDGNAFAILAYCKRLIEGSGGDGKKYFDEATAPALLHQLRHPGVRNYPRRFSGGDLHGSDAKVQAGGYAMVLHRAGPRD